MGSKYAADLAVIKTKQTLSVAPHFLVALSDIDEHPLHIVGETSRFHVTIINEEKKAVTARWTIKDLRQIKNGIADARAFVNFSKWSRKKVASQASSGGGTSPAYTTHFVMGNGLKGKTPAEIYAEDTNNFKSRMEHQYKYIEGNLGKNGGQYDKANRKQMDAISDALQLLADGKLAGQSGEETGGGTAGVISVFEPVTKPLIRNTDKVSGLAPVYTSEVNVYPNNTYPVEIKITNFNAPVEKRDNGTLNVKSSLKKDEFINRMMLSFADFENMLQEMEDYVNIFKMMNAKKCFADSERCINENKKAAEQEKNHSNSSALPKSNHQTTNLPTAASNKPTPQGNSLHARSISPADSDNNGNYEFWAQKDNGEQIRIRVPNSTRTQVGDALISKFIQKTQTPEGADFRFTGTKHFENGKVIYIFSNFATV